MYPREYVKSKKKAVRMDPDCAICHAPASMECDCEAKRLEIAVKQAEQRMMQSMYSDIRTWVRKRAQDYILEYYRLLVDRRKQSHADHMEHINQHSWHYYQQPPPHAALAQASQELKRGIDEDWQASVQRYPEVLEYFFSLVSLALPPDDDPSVKDPPLSALSGSRKGHRRPGIAPAPAQGGSYEREPLPMRREPTPMMEPRPVGRIRDSRRQSFRGAPPPPPTSYYGQPPPPPW
ncbi:hypothetical protein B0T11DRAFT_331683 [Plectosphaerella cucumerina]|uniref:Uncharacterized protein n=1 Tax=Plectosphaerella cucumerina TaxID=40658 RepID=A0A8K0T9G2_9PEZI|nr:hypothetical protein B0T11DRAFT_331683 [Plectosphaerella cucumerina]